MQVKMHILILSRQQEGREGNVEVCNSIHSKLKRVRTHDNMKKFGIKANYICIFGLFVCLSEAAVSKHFLKMFHIKSLLGLFPLSRWKAFHVKLVEPPGINL